MKKQTTYIIGGSKGIGLETAKQLVRRDEAVTLVARSETDLKSASELLAKSSSVPVDTIVADLYDHSSVDHLIKHI